MTRQEERVRVIDECRAALADEYLKVDTKGLTLDAINWALDRLTGVRVTRRPSGKRRREKCPHCGRDGVVVFGSGRVYPHKILQAFPAPWGEGWCGRGVVVLDRRRTS